MTFALPKLLIVEDDEGLQRQLRWAYDDYEVIVAGEGTRMTIWLPGVAVDEARAAA